VMSVRHICRDMEFQKHLLSNISKVRNIEATLF